MANRPPNTTGAPSPPGWAVAILIFLAGQTISAVWWGGSINERMLSVERRVTSIVVTMDQRSSWAIDIARLQTTASGNAAALRRIEDELSDQNQADRRRP